MSEAPCTRAEAYKIVFQDAAGWEHVTPEGVRRLRTLSDEDLATFCQSWDMFSIAESNRRLSEALRQEAQRTTALTAEVLHLTKWLVRLTVGLLGLTVLLAIMTGWLIWITAHHG